MKIVKIGSVILASFVFVSCGGGGGGNVGDENKKEVMEIDKPYAIKEGQKLLNESGDAVVVMETSLRTKGSRLTLKSGSASLVSE